MHKRQPAQLMPPKLGLPASLPAEVEDQSRREVYRSATHLACNGQDIETDQVPNE